RLPRPLAVGRDECRAGELPRHGEGASGGDRLAGELPRALSQADLITRQGQFTEVADLIHLKTAAPHRSPRGLYLVKDAIRIAAMGRQTSGEGEVGMTGRRSNQTLLLASQRGECLLELSPAAQGCKREQPQPGNGAADKGFNPSLLAGLDQAVGLEQGLLVETRHRQGEGPVAARATHEAQSDGGRVP